MKYINQKTNYCAFHQITHDDIVCPECQKDRLSTRLGNNPKHIITIIMSIAMLMIVAGVGYAAGNCYANLSNIPCNITAPFQLQSGLNIDCSNSDVSQSQYCIKLTTNAASLDCNGSQIFGVNATNTYGIFGNSRNDLSIYNCVVHDFSNPINFNAVNRFNMSNLTVYNSNSSLGNIFISQSSNGQLINITSYGASGVHGNHGLYISSNSGTTPSANITITKSRFFNNVNAGIHLNSQYATNRANNIVIFNNTLINNGDCVNDDGSINTNISYNYMENCDDGILATQDPTFLNGTVNGKYFNNIFYNLPYGALKFYPGAIQHNAYNNIYLDSVALIRMRSNISSGYGVSYSIFENTTQTYEILWEAQSQDASNAVVNITYSGLKNFTVTNNTITLNPTGYNYSCANSTDGGNTWTGMTNNVASYTFTAIANSNYQCVHSSASGGCDYPQENQKVIEPYTICSNLQYIKTGVNDFFNMSYFNYYNLTYNSTPISSLKIINRLDGTLYFNSPITKDLTIINNSYYMRSLKTANYPYFSVFTSSSSSPNCTESSAATFGCDPNGNVNGTILPNNRTIVFEWATATEPRYTMINKSISTITPIAKSKRTIEFNCTGEGMVEINNTYNWFGRSYRVYHNGVFVAEQADNIFRTDGSCSTWVLTLDNIEVKSNIQSVCMLSVKGIYDTSSLLPMAISVLFLIIILPIVLLIYSNNEQNYVKFTQESVGSTIFIAIGIVIVVIMVMLGLGLITGVVNIFC